MQQPIRTLTASNVDGIREEFCHSLAEIGPSVRGLTGLRLLNSLKRDRVGVGPYPNVTLFEAANRIMSDLVILYGIAGLLRSGAFPFDAYTVEFGNENRNDFDIQANSESASLRGEAFNVSRSLFPGKNRASLSKLRTRAAEASHRIILFNSDACLPERVVRDAQVDHIRVDIESGQIWIPPRA